MFLLRPPSKVLAGCFSMAVFGTAICGDGPLVTNFFLSCANFHILTFCGDCKRDFSCCSFIMSMSFCLSFILLCIYSDFIFKSGPLVFICISSSFINWKFLVRIGVCWVDCSFSSGFPYTSLNANWAVVDSLEVTFVEFDYF